MSGSEQPIIGKDQRLHKFLMRTPGGRLTRIKLNILMCIGMFVGIFVPFVFWVLLGGLGMALGFLVASANFFIGLWVLSYPQYSQAALMFILAYLAVWVYANMVLSRYERLAKERIDKIENEGSPSIDDILEKAILLQYFLNENNQSLEALRHSLSMQGGNALLWYLSAAGLVRMKAYPDVLRALDRATEAFPDRKLLKMINQLRKLAQKKTATQKAAPSEYCTHCGHSFASEDAFCPNCGAKRQLP